MHVQRVITNETCNQNCWFCNARQPTERPDFVSKTAVRSRIEQARTGQTEEIVLTGGEPTLRSDVADLIQRAASGGIRVVLETNGTVIDAVRAQEFAAAGLRAARVQLVAWGDEAADPITRAPGEFAAALRGIYALAAAGVQVEVTTPIVRRNLASVAALPREIAATKLPVAALVLVIPTTAPDPTECAPLAAVGGAVTAVVDAARRVGLAVRLDPSTFMSPCLFEKPERVAHVFALNRGNAQRAGFQRVTACTECLVSDRCPGIPQTALQAGSPPLQPIKDDRVRRRLTVVSSVEQQVAREFITRDVFRGAEGPVPEYTIRVNFHCNQACEFCFVSTHLPPPAEAVVRRTIEDAASEGAVLVLSGGEPTLNPRLVEYVQLAKRHGARAVELQTNAVRLADRALTRALAEAGLERAMVSLHGSSAALSDGITGAPGTFAATVRGIDELLLTSIATRLNFVFCQANREDFPRFVDLVAARWPRAGIVFSFVGSHTDVVPRSTALIPRFTEVLPSLTAGLARARAARLTVSGFDSMCGMPLCLVPATERFAFSQLAVAADAGGGEFVKAETCTRCDARHRCFGVRRGYAELYGTAELRALDADAGPSMVN